MNPMEDDELVHFYRLLNENNSYLSQYYNLDNKV